MPKKLSKVIQELNVGSTTIEEFLRKKGVEIETNINARIPDEVYDMLITHFRPDMEQKKKSSEQKYDRFWTAERQQAAQALGLTPDEVVIIASIVEEETAKRDERGKVARLYLNVLRSRVWLLFHRLQR